MATPQARTHLSFHSGSSMHRSISTTSRILLPFLFALTFAGCALGFDSTVPAFDVVTEEDASGQQDAQADDVISDADVRPDAALQDVLDSGGGVDDAGSADGASDAGAAPTVTVSAPTEGEYTMGTSVGIRWSASAAETAQLSLVNSETCSVAADGVVLPNIVTVDAATGAYTWDVPTTVAVGNYRIRVVVSADAGQAAGCSPQFTLRDPPTCESIGCQERNRGCRTVSGSPVCGGCLEGFAEVGGSCMLLCSELLAPANGSVTLEGGTLFGATATYSCMDGHTLLGAATRTCEASGDWSGIAPNCVADSCGAVATVANATASVPSTTTGSTATFTCEPGYRTRSGTSNTQVCDGTSWSWTGRPLSCIPVVCGTLSSPVYGSVSTPSGVEFNDVATYSCNSGYTLSSGSATRTCEASGTWSGSPAVCSPVDCGAPPTVTNGSRTFSFTTYNSTASYTCNSGYTRLGPATLTCGATGSWGTVPTCNDTNECTSGSVCTATGNTCTNTTGSWQCSCAAGYSGTPVTGGNASCTLLPSLGATCSADSQCPSGSWCSTVSGYRRCSPRVFSGAAHQMDFVFVPSGTFQQGTSGATNEERPFNATISRNYFVSRTEVTQGQWKAATGGTNPSCFQSTTGTSCTTSNANNSGPVEQVDWYSAVAYANWLSLSQGLSQCYTLTPSTCADSVSDWGDGSTSCTTATFTGLTCTGYRLLTESEWERAARGNTTSTYYWGEATDSTTVGLYAWFSGNTGSRTQEVGRKQANNFGLLDMSGNAWEWVWDWVAGSSGYFSYPSGSTNDYEGPVTGSSRGFRGGGWANGAPSLRSAYRVYYSPTTRDSYVGFRLARTAL